MINAHFGLYQAQGNEFSSASDNMEEVKNAPLWRGLTQLQTKNFVKSVKRWGIEKADKVKAENEFHDKFDAIAGMR